MLVYVAEIVVAAVLGALDAVGALSEVFEVVTAVVLLNWSIELVFVELVLVLGGTLPLIFESYVSVTFMVSLKQFL